MSVPNTEETKNISSPRRFNDAHERAAACNQSLIIGITVFYIIICIFAGMQISNGISKGLQYSIIAVAIASVILDWILFLKLRRSGFFYKLVLGNYFIIYALTLIAGGYDFIQFTIIAVFIVGILYYDLRNLLLFSALTLAANLVQLILWMNGFAPGNIGLNDGDSTVVVSSIFRLIFVACLLYTVVRITYHGKAFNRDIFGTIEDEHQKQKRMLEDILEIASVIQENTVASASIVNDLGESTGVVNEVVSQISTGTQATAENIQEQNVMTQSIQASINETVNHSKQMVSIANESNESIVSSLEVMNSLKNESEQIAVKNNNLIDSMNRLQEKTQEVQDIAEIINSISSQTNLLSLNASIESARAGEAGKGFAVVANQIRKLAEQTKESTESISRILQELNSYAKTATATVKDTIQAVSNQGVLISDASEGFNQISRNVSALIEDIGEIDKMLVNLAEANSSIVENISHISATTQEVSASAQEASAISEKSASEAEEAKRLLNEVLETSHRMDKYLQ